MNNMINDYKTKLSHPMGLMAQLKMAPSLREKELIEYNNEKIKSKSAVLIILYSSDNKLFIVLTKRSKNLRKHSGQISFPGGKLDRIDDNLTETAFREAKEEIGFENKDNHILGWLSPLIIPITNFVVYPLVVFSENKPKLIKNNDEVESIIRVPINFLTNINNIKKTNFLNSTSGRFLEAPYFDVNENKVWGATAMIISELLLTLFPDSDFSKQKLSF